MVARRYKTPVGEIDLLALKGRRLAFIEVKRRKSLEDALPARQRRLVVRAAQYWLAATPISPATTSPSTWCSPRPGVPRYIKNAFPV
jgi:putative endonuclease